MGILSRGVKRSGLTPGKITQVEKTVRGQRRNGKLLGDFC